jgi:predicted O-methyltransferase YrrM
MNVASEFFVKSGLAVSQEPSDHVRGQFYRFDDGSAEVEVLEFLYSLVRIVKPNNVLETGSYWGLTASYMALGLRDNHQGMLNTIEFAKENLDKAKLLWNKLSLDDFIIPYEISSMDFVTDKKYELVLLDTEPQLRFQELEKFWDNIVPGGIIVIHDLSWDLGSGAPQFWLHKEIIDQKIKDSELQVINFLTPRGITLLQKFDPTYESFKLHTK